MSTTIHPSESTTDMAPAIGQKSFVVTWLLSLFLGIFGIDRFYLGKVGTGILKLVTFGGVGVWALVDLIIILCGGMRDKRGLSLRGYAERKAIAWIVTGALIAISAVTGGNTASQAGQSAADVPATAPTSEASAAPAAKTAEAAQEASTKPAPAKEAAGTWTQVATLKGKADSASSTFELTGAEARMTYNFAGSGDMVLGSIYLLTEGTDLMVDGGVPEVMIDEGGKGSTALHKSPGTYFLDVNSAGFTGWTVMIEEKQ